MSGKAIMVTGGTGSFGQLAVRLLLEQQELVDVTSFHDFETRVLPSGRPLWDRVIVYSRDELKQSEMRHRGLVDPRLRYFLGDVRDRDRLRRAMAGVTEVVHAAALKQVDSCEYNPTETNATNVQGTENVINAALDCGVEKVIMVGTDKAVDPVNTYGVSKAMAERLIVDANAYGGETTKFAATRYGNVLTSRGSVLPLFVGQRALGKRLTVTDPAMTRFVLTLEQGVGFVLDCLGRMRGGEVFVPRLPTATVMTVAAAVTWPDPPQLEVGGRRPGEKRHELLVSENEADRCRETKDGFVLLQGVADSGRREAYGSNTSEGLLDRLDVDGFRRLAGLGATLEEAAV